MKKILILIIVAILPYVAYASDRGEKLHNLVRNEVCDQLNLILIETSSLNEDHVSLIDLSGNRELEAAKKVSSVMKRFSDISLYEPWSRVKDHLNCIYYFENYFLIFKIGKLKNGKVVLILITSK